jgi:hypothetical protein
MGSLWILAVEPGGRANLPPCLRRGEEKEAISLSCDTVSVDFLPLVFFFQRC